MFKNFEVRKFIAIVMTIAFIIYTGVTVFTGIAMPEYFGVMVASVISYYFGKSTALDVPPSSK